MEYDRSKDPMLAMDYWKPDAPKYQDLHREIAELKQQRDELRHQLAGMTDSAKHYSNGMEYYRGLIDEAAKSIGIAMYTADDQGVHPDPLRAKLPECVAELVQQRDELLAALKRLWIACPSGMSCEHFDHSKNERHSYKEECKPAAEYLAAIEQANAAIAKVKP